VSGNLTDETLRRVRAAIKDRAVWFALLYRQFLTALPPEKAEALARKAIREYGRYKGSRDPRRFGGREYLEYFRDSGGAQVFGAELTLADSGGENRVYVCPLVDAWREMGCSAAEIDLFCDIAMDGDRGRAEYHGLDLELGGTLACGAGFCRLRLNEKGV